MITALLIIFALMIEYIYDPISNMKDIMVIDKTFDKYKSLAKGYIKTKYYLYISFPIIIMFFFLVITYLLDNYLHSFFSFILYQIQYLHFWDLDVYFLAIKKIKNYFLFALQQLYYHGYLNFQKTKEHQIICWQLVIVM